MHFRELIVSVFGDRNPLVGIVAYLGVIGAVHVADLAWGYLRRRRGF